MKLAFITFFALLALGCSNHPTTHTPMDYSGQQTREIKSLSADDIKQLESGKGWGFAKAAELNGMPGPLHVLEMKKKIDLTPTQLASIESLFDEMKKEAVPLGKRLVELERKLDTDFSKKTIDNETLNKQLSEIAKVTAELRFVHLSTHLKTPKILTAKQITQYNELRGYGKGDPCKNIPEGHNPEMWKKHNNCS